MALDQSPASDIIIDCLPHVKLFGTQKVTLFTSVSYSRRDEISGTARQKWRDKLDEYAAKLSDATDMQVKTRVEFEMHAYAPQHILKGADNLGADYIIIANRGHNKFRDILLGSTVAELLQRCNLPVYLIKLKADKVSDSNEHQLSSVASCQETLKHVLYPTDFSLTAQRAFECLCTFASENVERITLYHVQAKGHVNLKNAALLEEFNRIDLERLRDLKEKLEDTSNADIDVALSQGSATQHIVEKAKSVKATMIIMGSQGRGYISDLFLGGVSYQVLRNTPVPVLIIPARRDSG